MVRGAARAGDGGAGLAMVTDHVLMCQRADLLQMMKELKIPIRT
eukprot:COSAG02_NODE_17595_length_992_cov_2.645017_1_plen_43_part_10